MKHTALSSALVLVAAALAQGCSAPETQADSTEATSAAVAAPAASTNEEIPLQNASFIGDAEKRLPGWIKSEHGGGQSYTFQSDDKIFHSAPSSARVERHGPELFGMLSQSIAVDPKWHGRTIRVSAFVKGEGLDAEGRGGGALIIRADRIGGGFAGQNFMEADRLQGRFDWRRVEVDLLLPPLAGTLRIGAMLQGGGRLWIDDMAAELLP